jgi:hypothetical protein
MAAKHGIDAFLGRNTATWGSPTWAELTGIGGLTPGGGWDAVDINVRRSRVKMGAKVKIDIGFTGHILCEDSDAGYVAFMAAWRSLTATIDLIVLDGDVATVGSFGFRAEYQITEGGQDQPTDNVLWRDFKAVPYPTVNAPQFAEVTAGPAITYTTI